MTENFDANPPLESQVGIVPPRWLPRIELSMVDEFVVCIKKLQHKNSPGADGVTC